MQKQSKITSLTIIVFSLLVGCQSKPTPAEKTPLEQVSVAECASNWSAACERAINAPSPELKDENPQPAPKKQQKKFRRKKTNTAIKVDELFKGDVELSVPGSHIDDGTEWDGAFGD